MLLLNAIDSCTVAIITNKTRWYLVYLVYLHVLTHNSQIIIVSLSTGCNISTWNWMNHNHSLTWKRSVFRTKRGPVILDTKNHSSEVALWGRYNPLRFMSQVFPIVFSLTPHLKISVAVSNLRCRQHLYVETPQQNTSIFVSVNIQKSGYPSPRHGCPDGPGQIGPCRATAVPARGEGLKPSRGDVTEFTNNGDMVGMALAWPVV